MEQLAVITLGISTLRNRLHCPGVRPLNPWASELARSETSERGPIFRDRGGERLNLHRRRDFSVAYC